MSELAIELNKELEQQKLTDKQIEFERIRHKYRLAEHKMRLKELEFQRENDKIKHERELERQRIRSAEIKKSYDRRHEYYEKNHS